MHLSTNQALRSVSLLMWLLPLSLGQTATHSPMSIVAKWLDASGFRIPLGTAVGLGPGDIVLVRDPAPPPKKRGHSPHQFSAHVYCSQTAGWIKMPLGTKVGLGPCHVVLDRDPAPPKWVQQPSVFGPCLLWPQSPISATAELLLMSSRLLGTKTKVLRLHHWFLLQQYRQSTLNNHLREFQKLLIQNYELSQLTILLTQGSSVQSVQRRLHWEKSIVGNIRWLLFLAVPLPVGTGSFSQKLFSLTVLTASTLGNTNVEALCDSRRKNLTFHSGCALQ